MKGRCWQMPGENKCLVCLLYTVISQSAWPALSIAACPVAAPLISFWTAPSSGYSALSLPHLLRSAGTVIFVAVSEMCIRGLIHQENIEATLYINKTKQSLLGLLFLPRTDLFPEQAHSVIAQTLVVAQLRRQQQAVVQQVAEGGLFVSALLPKECLCDHRLGLFQQAGLQSRLT